MNEQDAKDVRFPHHYIDEDSQVECKEIIAKLPMFLGSAIKYVFRHQYKGTPIKDLEKAIECLKIHENTVVKIPFGVIIECNSYLELVKRPLMNDFALMLYNKDLELESELTKKMIIKIDNLIKKEETKWQK